MVSIARFKQFFSGRAVNRGLIAFFFIAASLCSYFRVFELYELPTYDWRCRLRIPRPVSSDIVLIDIADDSLEKIGHWPFSRIYHSALVDILHKYGAKAVIFDMLFVESSDVDAEVVQSLKRAGNVYLATVYSEPKRGKDFFSVEKHQSEILKSYQEASKNTGFVNVIADMDGKRRRIVPLVWQGNEKQYYLGMVAAFDALGIKKEEVKMTGRWLVCPNGLRLPLDDDGYFLVNYAGLWKETFQHYSYADILISWGQKESAEKPVVNLDALKGKICFVGFTATASHDVNANPLEPVYVNVGIHANVLNSILENDFVSRLGRLWNVLILLALSGWILFVSLRQKPATAFRVMLLTLCLFTLTVVFIFYRYGLWIDLFYPFCLAVILFAVATFGRMLHEMRKREIIESELKVASQIQQSFLPESLPERKGLDLCVYMKPAKAVGGDLYAVITPDEFRTGVMLGDVSGKGTPAALFMAKAVSEFKFSARDRKNPAQTLSGLNDSVASESTGGLFVTMAYAIFDLERKKVQISNGGHLPVVFVRQSGESELLSANDGMPIGVLPGAEFDNCERDLRSGDVFILYSDGVSEARNRRKEEYGIETLQKLATDKRHLTAKEMKERLVTHLNQFMGKADQHDDITFLIVKVDTIS